MYFVYVLFSPSLQKLYIGQTANLQKRIKHHNLGLDRWSKRGIPWKLVYSETFHTRGEALKREKYLKSGRGHQIIYLKLSQGGSRPDGI